MVSVHDYGTAEAVPFPRFEFCSSRRLCRLFVLSALLPLLLGGCRRQHFPQYPPDYREFAYVTNGGSNTVTVLDLVNLRQDRVLAVGAEPTGVTVNPERNEVYAVNSGSGSVSVIDAENNSVVATIPVHRKPYFIDVDSSGRRAYVANSGSNNVSVIDLDERREIGAIGVGEAPGLARISPDDGSLVVTNRVSGSVSVIDPKTFKVRAVFAGCPQATHAVILPDSSKAFIACSGGHQVMALGLARPSSPIDSEHTDRLLSFLDVGKTPVFLALKPDGGEIFVSNFDSDSISEIATGRSTSSGLIIHGDKDAVVPHRDVTTLVEKLKTQKGIVIEQKVIPGANHFFDGKIEPLMNSITAYLDKRLGTKGGGRTTSAA